MGRHLTQLAQQDPRIVAITAAMRKGTGLYDFCVQYPDRFFDVGIAEEHALTMAAGMAAGGLRPVVALYSTFLQRGVDQLLHDVCLQKLPVLLCVDRCGPVGNDGETHQGVYDLAFLRAMPGLVVLSPADNTQLCAMIDWALQHDGPVAIRYARGTLPLDGTLPPKPEAASDNPWLSYRTLREGQPALITTGTMAGAALQAADLLAQRGVELQVLQAGCLSATDDAFLLAYQHSHLFVLEENLAATGYGCAVGQSVMQLGLNLRVHTLGLPDQPLPQADPADQFARCGLDAHGIAASIVNALGADQ